MGINIPDWKPIDFGGMADIPLLYQAARKRVADEELAKQNAATQKAYADNETQKISNEAARHTWEDARTAKQDQEKQDLDSASQLNPGSDLMRAVSSNSPHVPFIARAHHINMIPPRSNVPPLETGAPQPANDTTSDVAKWLVSGGVRAPAAEMTDSEHAPSPEVPGGEGSSLYGPMDPNIGGSFNDPSLFGPPAPEAAVPQPDAPAPDIDPDAETSARATMTPWQAEVAGQRFDLKAPPPPAPFGDPEYDGMYSRLIAQGDDPQKAEAKVLQLRGQNMGAAGRSDSLDQKKATQLTREEQIAKYGAANAQSGANAKTHASAVITAAQIRAQNQPNVGGTDPKVLNAWLSNAREASGKGGVKTAMAVSDMFDRVGMEFDQQQPPNAANEQMGIHSLAGISVSMGPTMAKVTNQAMNDIREAPGWLTSAENQQYRAFNGGKNMPSVVAMFRDAANRARVINDAVKQRAFGAVNEQAGINSPFGQDPAVAPYARAYMRGLAMDLGMDPDEVAPVTAPPVAPAVAPHHGRPRPAPHAPATPPGPTAPMTDQQAVQMAQQRYAKDPNDAVAAGILRHHGLLK